MARTYCMYVGCLDEAEYCSKHINVERFWCNRCLPAKPHGDQVCKLHKKNTIYVCKSADAMNIPMERHKFFCTIMHIAYIQIHTMSIFWIDKNTALILEPCNVLLITRVFEQLFKSEVQTNTTKFTYNTFINELRKCETYLTLLPNDIVNIIKKHVNC